MSDIQTFLGVRDVGVLAQAIVDTVAEPLSCSTAIFGS